MPYIHVYTVNMNQESSSHTVTCVYTVHCQFLDDFETYLIILHMPASYFIDTYLPITVICICLQNNKIAVIKTKNISNDYASQLASSGCSMIHELELLPIVLTQVPIYILKIFLLIFLFFGDSQLLVVCFLNILLLNLVSTFSVVLASSIYLIFIVVVTLCQVSRQLAS